MIKKPSGDKQVKQVNVLSLFDGLSCGQLALQRANIPVENYLASEIDKYAIQVTQKNFPYTIQLGDITEIGTRRTERMEELGIDLIIGGSPCQGFSFAGKQLNFKDPRSKLFFEFVKILKAIKPKYFLLENVRMKKENQDIISEYMGVEPTVVNSNLVSAQNRNRLYWTNIPFTMPEDKGIILADILQPDNEIDVKYLAGEKLLKNYKGGNQLNPTYKSQANTIHNREGKSGIICAGTHGYANGYVTGGAFRGRYKIDGVRQDHKGSVAGKTQQELEVRTDAKTNALTTVQKDNVVIDYKQKSWRKLTPIECERLQTVPDNYTDSVSNTQRYKMLGNGMTVDVIAHILKGIGK